MSVSPHSPETPPRTEEVATSPSATTVQFAGSIAIGLDPETTLEMPAVAAGNEEELSPPLKVRELAKTYFNSLVPVERKRTIIDGVVDLAVTDATGERSIKERPFGILPILDILSSSKKSQEDTAKYNFVRDSVAKVQADSDELSEQLFSSDKEKGRVKKMGPSEIFTRGERVSSLRGELAMIHSTYANIENSSREVVSKMGEYEKRAWEEAVRINREIESHLLFIATIAGERYYTPEQGAWLKGVQAGLSKELMAASRQESSSESPKKPSEEAVLAAYPEYLDRSWLTYTLSHISESIGESLRSNPLLSPSELANLKLSKTSEIVNSTLRKDKRFKRKVPPELKDFLVYTFVTNLK